MAETNKLNHALATQTILFTVYMIAGFGHFNKNPEYHQTKFTVGF